jgi:transcriptional regulator with XRE-family HTH domain
MRLNRERELLESFSANVRRIRRRKGLTQEQLAEKAGLAARFVQRLETGKANPSLTVFVAVAEALDANLPGLLRAAVLSKSRPGRPSRRLR